MHTNIIEKHEKVDLWPGKQNAYKCVCLNHDNSKYEATLPAKEVELIMYFKLIQHKLNERERIKLMELIEEYGHEKYEESETNQSMHDAGEDI